MTIVEDTKEKDKKTQIEMEYLPVAKGRSGGISVPIQWEPIHEHS